MPRQRWLVAVLAISALSVACDKKKKDDPKTDPTTAEKGGDKKDPAVAPKTPTGAQSDLGLIPVDSEAVFGVNWTQLGSSPLWKKFVEPEMAKDKDFVKNMELFKERCGFDPMTSVKSMSIGMKNLDGDKPNGVMVLTGPDKAKTLACADKWNDEAAKEGVTIKKDGDIVILSHKDGSAALTFLGNDRLLVVIGDNATVDGVKTAAKGGSTLSTSPAFVDMYGKINKSDSAWFLMNGNSKIFEQAAQMGLRPKAVFGSVNVTDGMSADVRARLESEAKATETVTNFKGQLQAMASMFDKLDLTNEGPDVRLSAAASLEKIEKLAKFMTGGGM